MAWKKGLFCNSDRQCCCCMLHCSTSMHAKLSNQCTLYSNLFLLPFWSNGNALQFFVFFTGTSFLLVLQYEYLPPFIAASSMYGYGSGNASPVPAAIRDVRRQSISEVAETVVPRICARGPGSELWFPLGWGIWIPDRDRSLGRP